MKNEIKIKSKLEELERLNFNWYPYDEDFKIKNIDEYNVAIRVLRWVLED